MADPFSIVATVIGLAGTGIKISKLIYEFTTDLVEAPSSLKAVANELSVLCKVFNRLERSLVEDFDSAPPFPVEMSRELREVLNSCMTVFEQLERIVTKFAERKKGGLYDLQKRVKWVLEEKNISKIRLSLETHKETLSITLMVILKYAISDCAVRNALRVVYLTVSSWNTSQINKDTKAILRIVDKLLDQAATQAPEPDNLSQNLSLGTSSDTPLESSPNTASPELFQSEKSDVITAVTPYPQNPADHAVSQVSMDTNVVAQVSDKASVPRMEPLNEPNRAEGILTLNSDAKETPDDKNAGESFSHPDDQNEVAQATDILAQVSIHAVGTEILTHAEDESENVQTPLAEPVYMDESTAANEEAISHETSEAVRVAVETGNLEMVLLLLDFAGKVDVNDLNYAAALESAVINGHETAVRSLLQRGADVNAKGPHFISPLMAALRHQKIEMAEILVANGADGRIEGALSMVVGWGNARLIELLLDAGADVETKGSWGNNQLILAVRSRKIEALKVLLDRGANVNETGEYGRTALTVAIGHENIEMMRLLLARGADSTIDNAIKSAAERLNGHKLLKVLIDAGAKVIADQSCIAVAAGAGNVTSIKMLLDAGADIEAKGSWGNGPLIFAVRAGKMEALETLLDRGANVNETGEYGATALTVAIDKENVEMMKLLLSRGADATINDAIKKAAGRANGHVLLKVLLDGGARGIADQSCIAVAAGAGNVTSIKMLLDAGADIEAKGSWGNGPLIFAVRAGKMEALETLLDRGANVNETGEYGATALTLAIDKENMEMMKLLLSRGADATINNAIKKAAGRANGHLLIKVLIDGGADAFSSQACVSAAAEVGNEKSIKLLLEAGADIEAKGPGGNGPLISAVKSGKIGVLKVLLDNGADVDALGHGGRTALINAIELDKPEMMQLLLAHGADATIHRAFESAAVHQDGHRLLKVLLDGGGKGVEVQNCVGPAAKTGNVRSLAILIDAGANIEERDRWRNTPLILAVDNSKLEAAKMLLDRGADVNGMGHHSRTALHKALEKDNIEISKALLAKGVNIEIRSSVLSESIKMGRNKHTNLILDTITTSDTNPDTSKTLLLPALKHNRPDILETLIQKGANPNLPGIIQEAVKSGNVSTVNKMLDCGVDINIVDPVSGTLLQIAATAGHEAIVALLLDRGFDPTRPGCGMGPALMAAIKAKHNGVARMLLLRGREGGWIGQ